MLAVIQCFIIIMSYVRIKRDNLNILRIKHSFNYFFLTNLRDRLIVQIY